MVKTNPRCWRYDRGAWEPAADPTEKIFEENREIKLEKAWGLVGYTLVESIGPLGSDHPLYLFEPKEDDQAADFWVVLTMYDYTVGVINVSDFPSLLMLMPTLVDWVRAFKEKDYAVVDIKEGVEKATGLLRKLYEREISI